MRPHKLASPRPPATRVQGAPFVSAYSYRARSAALSSSSKARTSVGTLPSQAPGALPAEFSESIFCPSMAGERPSACHSIPVELFKVSVVRMTSKLSKTWRASACRQRERALCRDAGDLHPPPNGSLSCSSGQGAWPCSCSSHVGCAVLQSSGTWAPDWHPGSFAGHRMTPRQSPVSARTK